MMFLKVGQWVVLGKLCLHKLRAIISKTIVLFATTFIVKM